MKNQILTLFIGILVGAIITTGVFMIVKPYSNNNDSKTNITERQKGNRGSLDSSNKMNREKNDSNMNSEKRKSKKSDSSNTSNENKETSN